MAMTLARVREVLHYDQNTGVFTWLKRLSNRGQVGAQAGTILKNGYRSITVDGDRAYAHRLALFYVHGYWPTLDVDHANGVKDDNWLANLRPATVSQNLANQKAHRDSASGLKGVTKSKGRWLARIFCDGRRYGLGTHDTPELAHAAYRAKAKELFGSFARAE